MELQKFTDIHLNILKSWFNKEDSSNRFISYYAHPDGWLRLVDGTKRRAYAAIAGNRMVGFVDLEFDDENGASFAFGIDPTLRGKGFGSKLIQEIEKKSEELGATTLYGGVERENVICQRVLEKAEYSIASSDKKMINYIKILHS